MKNFFTFIIIDLFILIINIPNNYAIEQYNFDLGNIQKKSNLHQIISITNKSKSSLLIQALSTECGCLNASILTSKKEKINAQETKIEILPMNSFLLSIILKTTDLQGVIDKRIYLKASRNNKNILFIIHIKGKLTNEKLF